jgi:hypothetical protein
MQAGKAPIDPVSGLKYELHHIGQTPESTIAILTKAEHMQGGNNLIWHNLDEASQIDREVFAKIRAEFWQKYAANIPGGV